MGDGIGQFNEAPLIEEKQGGAPAGGDEFDEDFGAAEQKQY